MDQTLIILNSIRGIQIAFRYELTPEQNALYVQNNGIDNWHFVLFTEPQDILSQACPVRQILRTPNLRGATHLLHVD